MTLELKTQVDMDSEVGSFQRVYPTLTWTNWLDTPGPGNPSGVGLGGLEINADTLTLKAGSYPSLPQMNKNRKQAHHQNT